MGVPSRQGEPALLFPVLARHRRLVTISPPATIEGEVFVLHHGEKVVRRNIDTNESSQPSGRLRNPWDTE